MKTILVVASCPGSPAREQLVVEALRSQAGRLGYAIVAEHAGQTPADPTAIAAAALVFIASDEPLPLERFKDHPVFRTRPAAAIRHTAAVLDSALASLPADAGPSAPAARAAGASPARRLVAITSCPTGIAHTFMAAEALKKGARALGHEILVETQGSVGAQNALTPAAIAAADAVVIAADTNVALGRFAGKPLHACSTKAAIHDAPAVIRAALALPPPAAGPAAAPAPAGVGRPARTGAYKHLMTGVSHMLPVVIAGGLALALAFALGGIYPGDQPGTLGAALSRIGGGTAFHLMVAILAGYIAYSIADRPGLAAGFVGGMLAQELGAGFLGGIIAGFLAGGITRFLATRIRLPAGLEALKPILILPLLSTLSVGLLMIYVVGPPVQLVLAALTGWLNAMRGTNALLLGLLLGAMMAFDMGGPVNKAAYTFSVGLLGAQVYGPMAAVMAAGMTPPLGLALASLLAKHRFDADDRRAGGATAILGLSFITEGAIPYAAKDPLRVIPALVLGSAAAGAISLVAGVQLLVPHGGVFVLLIPGAVAHFGAYVAAIVTGTLLTTGALLVLKRPLAAPASAPGLAPA